MKKIRYCGQVDDFSCAAIALGNALKYFGAIKSYHKNKKKIIDLIGCDKHLNGTDPGDFGIALCHLPWELESYENKGPTPATFDKMLRNGYGAITRHKWAKWSTTHYSFFEPLMAVDCARGLYTTANFWGGSTARKYVSKDDLNKNFFGKTKGDLWVWFVRSAHVGKRILEMDNQDSVEKCWEVESPQLCSTKNLEF